MREVSFIIFIYMSLLRYSPYIVCLFSAYIRLTFLDTCFNEVIPWQKYAYFSVVHHLSLLVLGHSAIQRRILLNVVILAGQKMQECSN